MQNNCDHLKLAIQDQKRFFLMIREDFWFRIDAATTQFILFFIYCKLCSCCQKIFLCIITEFRKQVTIQKTIKQFLDY